MSRKTRWPVATVAVLAAGVVGLGFQWWRMTAGFGGSRRVAGLRLREFADSTEPPKTLVVFLTSDVGWIGLNSELPKRLGEAGHAVVAWNSLAYYVRKRTPRGAAADLERLFETYRRDWGVEQVALVGYSWGAGAMPFLVNRLSERWRERISSISLLAYPGVGAFHFHPSAWRLEIGDDAMDATPEIAKLPRVPSLCVAGEDDPIRDCRALEPYGFERRIYPVAHSLTPIVEELMPVVTATIERGERRFLDLRGPTDG